MEDLKPVTIMLVEDDVADRKLIEKSLPKQKIANDVRPFENGEKALDYLSRSKSGQSNCPMPNLVLLDLNMPGMGGKEFLRRIKADEQLDTIPVVIFTTSDFEQDVIDSYKLHAAGYIKKPLNLAGFQNVMTKLEDYWFVICRQVPKSQLQWTGN